MNNSVFVFNRSDYRLIIAYLIISSIWLMFKYITQGIYLLESLIDVFKFCVQIIIALFFFRWIIEVYILEQKKYIFALVTSLIFLIILGCTTYLIGLLSGGENISNFFKPLDEFVIKGFTTSAPDVALPLALIFGKKFFENRLNTLNLINIQKESKLRILRAQFDPHFLFNSLNTIDALIDYEPQKAKKYLSKLSSLYRALTTNSDEDIMPLVEELSLVEDYIYLIQIRFENDYKFNIQVDCELENKYILSNALQITVENIIKHNKAKRDKKIEVNIIIDESKIIITNNKTNLNHSKSERIGTGLKNLNERYTLLTDKRILVNDTNNSFKITLPLIKSEKFNANIDN